MKWQIIGSNDVTILKIIWIVFDFLSKYTANKLQILQIIYETHIRGLQVVKVNT